MAGGHITPEMTLINDSISRQHPDNAVALNTSKGQRPHPMRPPIPSRALHKARPVPRFAPIRRYLRREVIRLIDRGWFGLTPLRGHLVICGFPRSGTTLLQLMVETAVPEATRYGRERSGLGTARKHWPGRSPYLVTKRPDDIFWVDEIRDFYAQLGTRTRARFVICVRDPRAVLTSRHETDKSVYWVTVDRWRAIYDQLLYLRSADDVCVVEFKDLVSRIADVQQRLTNLMGWAVSANFDEFHKHVPQDFQTVALNGVRTLDSNTLERWARPEHADRIRFLLREMPELPERLIEMGYEPDDAWTGTYR
jgi:hypothetical protein